MLAEPCPKTAQIIAFPVFAQQQRPSQPMHRQSRENLPRDRMTFAEVAIALALDGYARNAIIIQKLRVLANPKYAHAMPLPINPRIVGGKLKSGPDAICAASIWSRRQFEYWRTGNSPDGAPNAGGHGADAQTSARLLAEGAAKLAGVRA